MTYSQFPPPQMQSSNPYDQNQANYQPQYANQQQQYGNQHQQQQQYGHQQKFNSQQPEKFTQPEQTTTKPKWNDLIFALLFLAQLGAFIAVAVISLRGLNLSTTANRLGSSGGNSITLNTSTAYLLSIIAAVGFVLSIFLLILVRLFTTVILEVTLFLSVILAIAYAVYLYIEKSYAAAVLATVFAVFAIVAYFPMRRRIPFSKALLLFVLRIAKEYPSVYVIAIVGALIQTIYSVAWSFCAVAIYQKWTPNASGSRTTVGTPSNGALIGLMVFAVFSFYWTSQFIQNLFLTTEAGIYGSFYFNGGGKSAPKGVAWGAFKRASTYSMGSIAFGSLIVALLELLRTALSLLQSYESGQGDMIGSAIACCASCCVGCIANLVEYFNRYAFIEIALYGKPYVKAAKDTWRLFKDRGITLLVNDSLINNIWTFGSIAVGALCSAFAYIYLKVSNPSYVANNPGIKSIVIGYAFIIGFFICHTLGYGALSSGVSTIFVGLAEDPQALAERDPALFEVIRQTYPAVVNPV